MRTISQRKKTYRWPHGSTSSDGTLGHNRLGRLKEGPKTWSCLNTMLELFFLKQINGSTKPHSFPKLDNK